MVRTLAEDSDFTIDDQSQSPQSGAMVRTKLLVSHCPNAPCLNPLKAGQWFGLGSPIEVATGSQCLNPLKAGQWFGH